MAKKIKISKKRVHKDRGEFLTVWEKIQEFIETNERILFIAAVAVITIAIAAIVFSIFFFKRQTDAKEIFNRGITAYHDAGYSNEDLEKALLSFSTVTDKYRMAHIRPLAFLYRGHVLYDLEEYTEAAEMYRKASERLDEPLKRLAVINRGYALEADESYDEAAEAYKILADKDDLEALTYLIRVLEKAGNTEEAEHYSDRYDELTRKPEDLLIDDLSDLELDVEEGLEESSDDSSDEAMPDDDELQE